MIYSKELENIDPSKMIYLALDLEKEAKNYCDKVVNINGCKISYGTTLEILDNAILNSGYFTVNCNSVIVVAKKMYLGQDVMIGRNAVLYDSDFHQMLDKKGKTLNPASQVKVGSHVWIGANSTILKGTMIGQNSVIGANAVVNGEVPEKVIFNIKREKFVRNEFEKWDRKSPN